MYSLCNLVVHYCNRCDYIDSELVVACQNKERNVHVIAR